VSSTRRHHVIRYQGLIPPPALRNEYCHMAFVLASITQVSHLYGRGARSRLAPCRFLRRGCSIVGCGANAKRAGSLPPFVVFDVGKYFPARGDSCGKKVLLGLGRHSVG
jgi:hypothetical protein